MSLTAKLQKQKTWEETKKYLQAFVQNLHLLSSVTGSREEEKRGGGGKAVKNKNPAQKNYHLPPQKRDIELLWQSSGEVQAELSAGKGVKFVH